MLMEAVAEKPKVRKKKVRINSLIPKFGYVNHLGEKVKNVKTATL